MVRLGRSEGWTEWSSKDGAGPGRAALMPQAVYYESSVTFSDGGAGRRRGDWPSGVFVCLCVSVCLRYTRHRGHRTTVNASADGA